MRTITILLQNGVRLFGVILLVLGFLFWSKHSYNLVPLHRWLGIILVVMLWALAGVGIRAGVKLGLILTAILWGALTVFFGMTMGGLLPGRIHELIRIVHLLIGLGAIGLSESLSVRIKRSLGAQ